MFLKTQRNSPEIKKCKQRVNNRITRHNSLAMLFSLNVFPQVNWFNKLTSVMQGEKKVFSKSLDTVRLPDPVNRLCKIKFTGVFECQESSIGTRGGPTGEADGSLYWEGVEPSWPSGWQRWLHCCCDGRGKDPSVGLCRYTHKSQLQQGLSLLVEV